MGSSFEVGANSSIKRTPVGEPPSGIAILTTMTTPLKTAERPGGWPGRFWVLLAVTALVATIVLRMSPIPQDPGYHRFADTRSWLGIPNFQNVASNLPFLFVGAAGLLRLRRATEPGGGRKLAEKGGWFFLFLSFALTAFGSGYYHWTPSNATLLWDRLPMTLGFMGLLAVILGERVGERAYRLLLWPLVGLGVASVLFWYGGEVQGRGDLRLYVLVQLGPLLLIPLVMALYRPRYSNGLYVFLALGWYGVAKILEFYDRPIFAALDIVGGHALKHLAAAMAGWTLVRMFSVRSPIES